MDGFTNYTNNGECSKCGQCCSNRLPLTPLEIKSIKNYIRMHKIKARNFHKPQLVQMDMTCPFLNENNTCNIYKIRPKICRIYKCNMDGMPEEYKEEFRNNGSKIVLVRELFYGKKV